MPAGEEVDVEDNCDDMDKEPELFDNLKTAASVDETTAQYVFKSSSDSICFFLF